MRPARSNPGTRLVPFVGRQTTTRILLTVLALMGGSATEADWLVMQDGSHLETKGTWTIEGERLVFSLPNGTLSSLKLSDVDLEASHKASLPPDPQAGDSDEPTSPTQKALFVLTDADVRHPSDSAADEPTSSSGSSSGPAEREEPLQAINWKDIGGLDGDGVVLAGTVRNFGDAVAAGLTLSVTLHDGDGSVLVTNAATLGASSLGPGKSTSFKAEFPGFFGFSATRFKFSYQPLKTNVAPPGPGLGRSDDND